MKKIILIAAMSVLTLYCQAQLVSSKQSKNWLEVATPEHGKLGITHYVRAGVGFAMILGSNEVGGSGVDIYKVPRFSFNVGYGAIKYFGQNWAIEGSAGISMKGYKVVEEYDLFAKHVKVEQVGTSWNMEIAFQGRYAAPMSFGELSLGFGPYIGIGLGGKYAISNNTTDEVSKYDYYGKRSGVRRCDFGFVYDVRYSFNRYMCGLQLMNGVISVAKGSNDKNFGFWFYGGCRF